MDSNAENYENDAGIEAVWAMKAFNHADAHFKMLRAVPDPQKMKLTAQDDLLYTALRTNFPDLSVAVVTEDDLKSEEIKPKWREFCTQFEGVVKDFNFGTLLRLDSSKCYSKENTILVTRVQFLAVEVTRNREGHNDNAKNISDES